MNIWGLLPEWKTCSSVVGLTAFERRSLASPMKTPQRGRDFLTRAVKHLWSQPLSECFCRFLQELTVFIGRHLVYVSCTGCGIMEQNACETWDGARCVFCSYSPAPEMLQEMPCEIGHVWENISSHLFALLTSMSLSNKNKLSGLFVFASRCICVAWVNSAAFMSSLFPL